MDNKNVMKYIKSDVYRYTGSTSFGNLLKGYLHDSLIRFHVAFRMRQGTGLVAFIGKILWFFARDRKRIYLSPKTQVGFGLYIGHAGPIAVHPSAIIGNNVNLSPYTVIGSARGKAAEIGDYTYIGPHVCVVEDVKIGKNVTIGAGSVVTKDIPDNATAVGNCAKVINYNDPGQYSRNNRWNDFELR